MKTSKPLKRLANAERVSCSCLSKNAVDLVKTFNRHEQKAALTSFILAHPVGTVPSQASQRFCSDRSLSTAATVAIAAPSRLREIEAV